MRSAILAESRSQYNGSVYASAETSPQPRRSDSAPPARAAGAMRDRWQPHPLLDADGNAVSIKQIGVRIDAANRFGVVNQLTGIALDVSPGSYSLSVAITGQDTTHSLPFSVREEIQRPIVHAAAAAPSPIRPRKNPTSRSKPQVSLSERRCANKVLPRGAAEDLATSRTENEERWRRDSSQSRVLYAGKPCRSAITPYV